MGIPYRSIRAAGSALLVAVAVGTGGAAGMTSALAADPLHATLTGSVADAGGAPLAGVGLVVTEELGPDGGIAAVQVTTAADGSFSADVFAWGTAAAPAQVTIATSADETIDVIGDGCSDTWSVAIHDVRWVALADGPADPFTLTATTSLLGEVCGTTATPPPTSPSGGGRPALTPPPTDTFVTAISAPPDRGALPLTIGFMAGILLAGLMLIPRFRTRRRD